MKYLLFRYIPLWALALGMLSCSKESGSPTASLSLINAVPNSTPSLVVNFSGAAPITWYKNALKLVYGTIDRNSIAMPYSGDQQLAIFRYPDTSAHGAPLFNLNLSLQPGNMHTLFLTGTLTSPDTLFTTDIIPYYAASDSSMGIRFVNLSAGSSPVSVNIAGSPNGSEVSSLSYKGITGFQRYPATAAVKNYNFEFRDAVTGALLGNLDVTGINTPFNNARRFRNFTLAYMGLPEDPATRKIILIETFNL